MRMVLILWCIVLCGCARRHASPGGITYFVAKRCDASAVMTGCDGNSPPNCKRIQLHYDKDCEQIVAHNDSKQ